MAKCEQETCPLWTGSGCACDVLDIDRPGKCEHQYYVEDESGNRLCLSCDLEWWEDPL